MTGRGLQNSIIFGLEEEANVGVGDHDPPCAVEIRTEERLKGDPTLVLLEGQVTPWAPLVLLVDLDGDLIIRPIADAVGFGKASSMGSAVPSAR